MHRLASILALCALSAACGAHDSGQAAAAPPAAGPAPAPAFATPPNVISAPSAEPEIRAFAAGNNAFALDLFSKLRSRKGNLAFSPFSLWTVLTMTWIGAGGDTAEQMRRVLHLERSAEEVLPLEARTLALARDPALGVTLQLAHGLFCADTMTFERRYVDRIRDGFGAPLLLLDFAQHPEESRRRMNAWVAEATHDRIKDIIPSNGVDKDTSLVAGSAIYFLGKWSVPFVLAETKPAPFHRTSAESRDVPTMHKAGTFRFAATAGVKVLEMSYEGGALAMTLVLPDRIDGLDDQEAAPTAASFDGWLAPLADVLVDVTLPKLEIHPPESLALDQPLKALGMSLAFDRERADFKGIATLRRPGHRLYLGNVYHKAFVKVDEKGSEAAAASAARANAHRGGWRPPKVQFHADHPFLFFIRDVRSGMILFMGRVVDPTTH